MNYLNGVARSLVPRSIRDAITLALLSIMLTYLGVRVLMPVPPKVQVFVETDYPRQVIRGSYFYLNFDLAFNKSCLVTARRYIVGNDGTEYLALEDSKEVVAGERMRYTVRIPVDISIPYGLAKVRSDFEYSCDWFDRYVKAIRVTGRERTIQILSESSEAVKSTDMCQLPPEPGYIAIPTHYRRVAKKRS